MRIAIVGLLLFASCAGRSASWDTLEPEPFPKSTKPVEDQEGTLVLSLQRCLELALGGNLEIRLAHLGFKERAEDFYIAGERFQPLFLAEAKYGDNDTPTTSTLGGASVLEDEGIVAEVRLSKTWDLGTRTDLVWVLARRETNSSFTTVNPRYESALALEIVQPLLQGFGADVNTADLRRAVNDREIAGLDLQITIEAVLLRAYRAYWGLLLAAENLALQEASHKLAREQVEIAEDRLAAGKAAPLEVVGAKASEARQSESVIVARAFYRKASDLLLGVIRPSSDDDAYEITVVPSTKPGDEPVEKAPSRKDAVRAALADRPELQRESLNLANAEIELEVIDNEQLLDLELFGRVGVEGIRDSAGDGLNDMFSADFPDWEVGLRLAFFFDSTSRKAQWRKAAYAATAAKTRREQFASEIVRQVRAALFDLEAARQRLEATSRTKELAREEYEGEADRFRSGRSTQFQVERLRRDLLDADQNHLRARIDVFIARAILDTAMGRFGRDIVSAARER